jgi:hypothetical protein
VPPPPLPLLLLTYGNHFAPCVTRQQLLHNLVTCKQPQQQHHMLWRNGKIQLTVTVTISWIRSEP